MNRRRVACVQAYRVAYRVCAAKTVTLVARYQDGVLRRWWRVGYSDGGGPKALVAAGIVSPARLVAEHGSGYRAMVNYSMVLLLLYFFGAAVMLRLSAPWSAAQLLAFVLGSFVAIACSVLYGWSTAV